MAYIVGGFIPPLSLNIQAFELVLDFTNCQDWVKPVDLLRFHISAVIYSIQPTGVWTNPPAQQKHGMVMD